MPASQPHPALDRNRTIQDAHCGPPDWVEVLQRVGRTCHGRIILTSNTSCKIPPDRLWVRDHPGPDAHGLLTGPVCALIPAGC